MDGAGEGGGCGRGGEGDVVNLTGRDGHCVVDNSWVVGRWGGGGGGGGREKAQSGIYKIYPASHALLMSR